MVWNNTSARLAQQFAIASACSATLIFASTYYLRSCRTPARLLLFYLTLCHFAQSLYYIFQDLTSQSRAWCVVEAYFALFVDNAAMLWTICITYYCYTALRKQHVQHYT